MFFLYKIVFNFLMSLDKISKTLKKKIKKKQYFIKDSTILSLNKLLKAAK